MLVLPKVTEPAELLSLVSAFEKITNGQRKALGLDEKREGSQADDDLDEALRDEEERERAELATSPRGEP